MAIASVVYPVGMTKDWKRIFSDIFKSMQTTASQMIAHHSVN